LILRAIDHINLIKLDSVYESVNSYYIILELFSGGNLRDYIWQNGLLNERKAANLIKNVLKGVSYLHNQNIMHRDIKPENILFRTSAISDETQVAIADLGLATFNSEQKYIFPRCGTPGYVAPEIAAVNNSNEHYELKCDLYSVGVTLFYVLTGRLPYPGKKDLMKENRECTLEFTKAENYCNFSEEGFFFFFFSSKIFFASKRLDFKINLPIREKNRCQGSIESQFFLQFK